MSTETTGPSFFLVDEIDIADESKSNAPRELVEEAKKKGATRKYLARGEGSFFSQISEFPAGYEVPMHSHGHDELIVVLKGGCTLMGEGAPTLKAHDSMVLAGGFEYGFTAGPEGMTFMTIRTADSGTALTK